MPGGGGAERGGVKATESAATTVAGAVLIAAVSSCASTPRPAFRRARWMRTPPGVQRRALWPRGSGRAPPHARALCKRCQQHGRPYDHFLFRTSHAATAPRVFHGRDERRAALSAAAGRVCAEPRWRQCFGFVPPSRCFCLRCGTARAWRSAALTASAARQARLCAGAASGGSTNAKGDEPDALRGAAAQPRAFFALGDNPLAWDDDVLSRGARLRPGAERVV